MILMKATVSTSIIVAITTGWDHHTCPWWWWSSRQSMQTGVRWGAWRLPECGRPHTRFVIFHFQTFNFALSHFHSVEGSTPVLSSFTFKLSLSNFHFRTLPLTLSLSNFHTFTWWKASHQVWHHLKSLACSSPGSLQNMQICYCKIQSFQPLKRVALILKTWSGYNFKPPSSPKLSSPSS